MLVLALLGPTGLVEAAAPFAASRPGPVADTTRPRAAAPPSVADVLDAHGRIRPGSEGSFDATGFRMTYGPDGAPVFVTEASAGAMTPGWSTDFNLPGPNSTVLAVAVSGSDLYIGGQFPYAEKSLRTNYVARWDGAAWTTLGNGFNFSVRALAVVGTALYATGEFTQICGNAACNSGNTAANYVARWNGTAWSALGSGLNNHGYGLAASGDDLYVVGAFSSAGGVSASRIARYATATATWYALGTGLGGIAYAVAVSGSDVYAGGTFTSAGGVPAYRVAKWNGSAWSSLGTTYGFLNGQVNAIAVVGTDVYVGGNFTSQCTNADCTTSTTVNRLRRFDGTSWSGFGVNSTVWTLAASGTDLYVGGDFNAACGNAACNSGNTSLLGLARYDGVTWNHVGSGSTDQGTYGSVRAFAVSGTDLYLAGDFVGVGASTGANRVAKWDGAAWTRYGSGQGIHAAVFAVLVVGDDVYVGGSFGYAGSTRANAIARWDGTAWNRIGYGFNGNVNALALVGSALYAGGQFTAICGNVTCTSGNTTANRVAKWDGSAWSALGSGVGGTVRALAASGTDLYVGGDFTSAGGATANRVAKWDGSAWSSLGTGAANGVGNVVRALATSGTDVYVGGDFTTAGGASASYVARWNGSAWSSLGSGLNSTVRALAASGTDLYVGGDFTTAGGATANRVAKWNGSAWSSLGSGGANGVGGSVYALFASGADVYVGGLFTTAGGASASYVAKWDGSAWSALGSGLNYVAYGVAAQAGAFWVGGEFNYAGGLTSGSFARYGEPRQTRVIAATTGLGNDQGWRVLAMPTTGATRADLEDDVTFETNSGSVLYTHSGSGYVAVTASATALTSGRGFLLYLFDQAVSPLETDRTLDVIGATPVADVTVSGLGASHQWHLLGNPYEVSFDLSSMDLAGSGFQATVQVWNPRTNQWQQIAQDAGGTADVLTAWQGFFAERTTLGAGSTSLTLPYSGRTTGGTFIGKGGEAAAVAARLPLGLRLTAGAGGAVLARDEAVIEARADAGAGWDLYDASKLNSLASPYATLSIAGLRDGRPWWQAVRSLPADPAAFEVPLRLRTGTAGRVELSWGEVPQAWQVLLADTKTGTVVDTRTQASVGFDVPGVTDDSTRFVLRIAPRAPTAAEPARAAEALEVSPVWPSPARAAAHLAVRVGAAQHVRVGLYDALGRLVVSAFEGRVEAGTRHEVVLPVSTLSPGVYLVRVAGERASHSRPLVVGP